MKKSICQTQLAYDALLDNIACHKPYSLNGFYKAELLIEDNEVRFITHTSKPNIYNLSKTIINSNN